MKHTILFVVFAIVLVAALAVGHFITEPLVEQQLSQKQRDLAHRMLSGQTITTIQDIELLAPRYLHMNDTQIAQRAYLNETPIAVIFTALTDYAYAGQIALLIALKSDCSIAGVEVLHSKETPGLGDQYKKNNYAWLKNFEGKNIDNAHWQLKKYGGDFDAWTGATITPKAIVESLERTLAMCNAYSADLFSTHEVVYIEY